MTRRNRRTWSGTAGAVAILFLLSACSGAADRSAGSAGTDDDWYRPAAGIEWQPWGNAALQRAAAEHRPVLLYLTNRWTHWSHRMERVTFTDADVIRLVNDHYVPVRADRDRFPELDNRYQAAASGSWAAPPGWPLAAFLTPAGDFLHAEGFQTPDDRPNRPGMRHVLQALAGRYREVPAELEESAISRTRLLQDTRPDWTGGELEGKTLADIVEAIRREYRPERGGRERLLTVPDDPALGFALLWSHRTDDSRLAGLVVEHLEFLAGSSLHDSIGGGFHRAAAGPSGAVPHFEKLLVTNAGLLELYLQAWQQSGDDRYREVAEGIVGFVLERLTDPDHGGFFNAVSGAIEPDRYGTYYTWTQEEIRSAVSAEQAKVLLVHFDVGVRGEIPQHPDRNVLAPAVPAEQVAASLSMELGEVRELLKRGRTTLRAERQRRPAPPVDRRVLAEGNGFMIRSMLNASRVLGREECRDAAIAALDRIVADNRGPDGLVSHLPAAVAAGDPPRLADQVSVSLALLDGYEAAGREKDLIAAREILEATLKVFRDDASGALLDLPADPDPPGLLRIQRRPVLDPLTPAANALAAMAFDRLSYLSKDKRYHQEAERILGAFAGAIGGWGERAATWAMALEHHLRHPIRVVVLGRSSDPATGGLTRAAHQVFHPGKMVLTLDPVADPERIKAIGYPPADRPVAYVCTDQACAPPVFEPDRIASTMVAFAKRAFERNPLVEERAASP